MSGNCIKERLVGMLLAAALLPALVIVALCPPMHPAWRLIARTIYADAPFLFRHARSLYDLCGVLCCLHAMLKRYPRAFDEAGTSNRAETSSSHSRMSFAGKLFRAARIRIEWDLLNGATLPDEPDMLDQMPLASEDPPRARGQLKAALLGHRVELTFRRMRMYAWMQGDAYLMASALAIRDAKIRPSVWRWLRRRCTRIAARLRGEGPLLALATRKADKGQGDALSSVDSQRHDASRHTNATPGGRSWRLRPLDWVLEHRLRKELRREADAFLALADHEGEAAVGKLVKDAKERRAEWTADAPTAPDADLPVVELPDCFAVAEVADDIKRYFNVLAEMALHPRRKGLARPYFSFISTVRIDAGYIAPLHLLAGVLSEFDENWEPAIRQYGVELSAWSPAQLPKRDLARLQAFAFNCWLSWGPSIPVCSCSQWRGWKDKPVYQFGYGDEGNSFPLVVEDPREGAALLQLFEATGSNVDAASVPLALPCSIDANLRWAPAVDVVCPAQHGIADGTDRLVLALSRRQCGRHTVTAGYYSAYVWVMFVLSKTSDPLRSATGKPSTSLLPLFEHGNIADHETFAAVKRRLARKAVSTLAALLDANRELVVHYACAFDDPNCSEIRDDADRCSRLEPLCRALTHEPLRQLLADEITRHGGVDRLRLGFEDWRPDQIEAFRTLYSACHLPQRVAEYLAELREDDNEDAALTPRSA